MTVRCRWAEGHPLLTAYHDAEWGVPERDSRALFEKLILDGFQAGLAWITILKKRDSFRAAFDGFVPERIAGWGEGDVERLMADAGIVRSRAKIAAAIGNAHAYLAMRDAGEAFAPFVWSFVDGVPWRGTGSMVRSPPGDALSVALKARGFKFVGPVIVHAWLQATGVIDDHEPQCFRRRGE